jgi:type IV pilus assembly protein PilE
MTSSLPRTRSAARRGVARRSRCCSGLTLLELLIVVAIVGVLGLVAIPSYRQFTLRAQRTDAKTALLRLRTNQERFYLTHKRYAGTADLGALGFGSPPLSERGAYALTVPIATTATYTAVATPTAGGAFDMTRDGDCTAFTITAEGLRGATGAPDADARCW